jgi:hypothetical protein
VIVNDYFRVLTLIGVMKKYFFLLPLVLLLVCCKSKKTSLLDEDEIEVADFIDFFPETELPFRVADTTLLKKTTDTSLQISYKIFTQFIPDSIIAKDFGKTVKPVFTALGKVKEKGEETYLFAKAVAGNKRVAYLATFNRKDEFMGCMPLVRTGFANYSSAYGMLDSKFQITTYHETRSGGEKKYKKNVYFYNRDTKDFTLIFTEPNEDIIENVINPIDTLPKKHKFAGDYVKDKRNFVSVRDGRREGEITIFIHFEKENGTCNGELKGTARFINNTTAQYHQSGNPCTIELSFTSNRVQLRETAGCGTYRDIRCFFDGTYPRKKASR